MLKRRIGALVLVGVMALFGWWLFREPREGGFFAAHPFRLGLDLSGGTALVYRVETASVPEGEIGDSLDALRDVIERRVNLFGVSEPEVRIQRGVLGVNESRLSVELPSVTDVAAATAMIGQTPLLEFRAESKTSTPEAPEFVPTGLGGRYLKRALLEFDPGTGRPVVSLEFDDEGGKLFEKITSQNIGKIVAIYLDGEPISLPVVEGAISGGRAVISGMFTPEEAKQLAGRLNSGALPIPITLISTQTIGATLGEEAVSAGVFAALIGFVAVGGFLLLWYRLLGLVGVLSLGLYLLTTLLLYRLIPVTLTAAGIAGFIISIGMAVDANILIFERFREELRAGKTIAEAITAGFGRAWFSIRDANTSTLITAAILFWFGTSLIKGFALTLGLGVVVSLLVTVTTSKLLLSILPRGNNAVLRFLYASRSH